MDTGDDAVEDVTRTVKKTDPDFSLTKLKYYCAMRLEEYWLIKPPDSEIIDDMKLDAGVNVFEEVKVEKQPWGFP